MINHVFHGLYWKRCCSSRHDWTQRLDRLPQKKVKLDRKGVYESVHMKAHLGPVDRYRENWKLIRCR